LNIYAINGSPRKMNNTVRLLEKCLEGAASEQDRVKLIHLYDYDFKGCSSCLACKTAKREHDPLCLMKDQITPLLKELSQADVLLFGSSLYLGDVSSSTRALLERLLLAVPSTPKLTKLDCILS
jgi:multimeric flavodoxin WrbA